MVVQGPRWGVLDMVKTYRDQRIPVYLTIHDHQWLFPEDPKQDPELSVLQTGEPGRGEERDGAVPGG